MIPVLSVLMVVAISLLVTRIAAVALVHTGLGREAARFQARSAFSGVGFTTSEAEQVVGHPVRRRIVMALMLVGNVGIVTALASLVLSFVDISMGQARPISLLVLAAGMIGLGLLAASSTVDRYLSRLISWALRRFTDIDARDYARLLHLREDYGITELRVEGGDWLVDRPLRDTRLGSEGVLVLGIECPGANFIGAPTADTEVRAGDTLLLYGRMSRISEIDDRPSGAAGEVSHREAMAEVAKRSQAEHERAGR